MSLAATLAADGLRPASFLPAIKCSNCGDEIEIAAMGDHICGRAPPSPKLQPASLSNPFTVRQMNAHGQRPAHPSPLQQSQTTTLPKTRVRAPTVTSNQLPAPKPTRSAPPQINPDVANQPFLAPRPPRSDSPLSPAISVRSGSSNGSRQPALRSFTSPSPGPRVFDPRPPSPELSCNLDCAFPPFPTPISTGTGSRPGTSNGRKTPTSSERAPSRTGSRQDSGTIMDKEYDARSPLSNSGESMAQRLNLPSNGPFDPRGRRPSDHEKTSQTPLDRRRPSLSSIKSGYERPAVPVEPLPRPSTSHANHSQIPRPSTAGSNMNFSNISRSDRQLSPQKKGPPARPDRPTEDVLSPRFLDELSAEPVMEMPSTFSPSQPPVPMRSNERSRTFPLRQESGEGPSPSQQLHHTPSEPQLRTRERRPTLVAASQSEPAHIPQAQGRQRSQSRSAPRMDHRLQDAPPVPKPVQQYRQEASHRPSDSGSSTASSAHSLGHSSSSSGPSPVGSAASSVDAFSALTLESSAYGEDEKMRVAGLNVKHQQKPGMRAEQPAQRSPQKNSFPRPSPPKQSMPPPLEQEPTLPALLSPPLESPMDPAMQSRLLGHGHEQQWRPPAHAQARPTLSRTNTAPQASQPQSAGQPLTSPLSQPLTSPLSVPKPGDDDYDPYRPVSPQPPVNARSRSKSNAPPPQQYKAYTAGSSVRPLSPQAVPPPPPIPSEIPRAQPPTRKGTVAKPTCRGCGLQIEGKSVKAADGRLTGRWHKACFTCRTCEQPFTTADFYVISNHPYCEQHYHEKNGSLCHGCNRGIEGQYLETTSSSSSGSVEKKFHPRCFTCHDCRQVLSDDYFEISGKVYCERHALAAMRGQVRMAGPGLQPPGRRELTAERRTTRLMMM